LLKDVSIRSQYGDMDREVKGISYDSRQTNSGHVFVAIRGYTLDGHDFIEDAVKRGAGAIVIEQDPMKYTERFQDISIVSVPDTRLALARMACAFYDHPCERLNMIGITGTNGKTTTTFLTRSILRAGGLDTGLIGTISYILGERVLNASNTTPESLDLQRYLREMHDSGITHVVMEVSSHALTLKRIEGCKFRVAGFTSFSQDHLDFHRTMDEYFEAKCRIFSYLGSDGVAVLNVDDERIRDLSRRLDCEVITCGLGKDAMIHAHDIDLKARDYGLEFSVRTPSARFRVRSRLLGRFNIYNILISIGIAHALGLNEETIVRGIEEAEPVDGRFEMIDGGQDFLCIVDYAHTPDALKRLLESVREITQGRIITVFGCGGDRDRTKRPLMGRVASEESDMVVLTSDNPRSEDPLQIIRDIEKGIRGNNYIIRVDREEAIREAVRMAKRGDSVVVAGKGHERYQEIKGRRYEFSDRDVVRRALRELVN